MKSARNSFISKYNSHFKRSDSVISSQMPGLFDARIVGPVATRSLDCVCLCAPARSLDFGRFVVLVPGL